MYGATIKIVNAQQAKLYNNYKNPKLKLLKEINQWVILRCGFSKEQCSSLKMILGSKHVGAILYVLTQKFYVCALVGVLIKWLYEMHGATIKTGTYSTVFGLFHKVYGSKVSQAWLSKVCRKRWIH